MFWLGKSIQSESKDEEKQGLSPIEYIILAHLRSRELRNQGTVGQYGYELIQELNKIFSGSWEAKSGTIYPILTKLDHEKELLASEELKSPLGPIKKIYKLTPNGSELIDTIVREKLSKDIDFILQYIELLAPFVIARTEENQNEDLFERLMQIPAKAHALAMEHSTTEKDQELKMKKLVLLKKNMEEILHNISLEIEKMPTIKPIQR
jgi:DNA-binding PadR family transcriptional regulator